MTTTPDAKLDTPQGPAHGTEATLLMNWYIHADGNVSGGGGDDPAGSGAATDADEDIAFALVMADRQWGGSGSLDRTYAEYANEIINDIWTYEIADERLPKNGSSWGSDSNLNISYFAPAYYRVFAKVTGDQRWGTNVVDYVYQVIDQNLVTFNRDPVTVCYGDSGAPTFFHGRLVAIASDGAADCASADVRARVDSMEVRHWIKSQIDLRLPF